MPLGKYTQTGVVFSIPFLAQLVCCLFFTSEPYADELEYLSFHPRRAPLYPLLLLTPIPWQLFHAMFHGLTTLGVRRLAGVIPALLFALYPLALYSGTRILSEPLTTCLVVWGIHAYKNRLDGRTGLLMGLATLARPTLLFLPLFTGRMRTIFVALLIVTPWSVYKSAIYDAPVLVAPSGLGNNVYLGSCELRDSPCQISDRPSHKNLITEDRLRMEAGLARIAQDPIGHLQATLLRIPMLWISTRLFWPTFTLFALFLFSCWRREWWVLMVPCYLTAVHANLHFEARYTIPARPFMIISICLGAVALYRFLRRRYRSGLVPDPGNRG